MQALVQLAKLAKHMAETATHRCARLAAAMSDFSIG
jgi:hypothetical protein